ncbi:MAG: hypothetical protein WAU99_04070 [Pseudolabrys sp.]
MSNITPVYRSEWVDIERPFPAFVLSIPEAADVPANYAIRRHAEGGGRKDILELGEPAGAAPYLRVEVYRPGSEIRHFADPTVEILDGASALGPIEIQRATEPLQSKFGPLTIVSFATSRGTLRHCRGSYAPIAIHDCKYPAGFVREGSNSSNRARWHVRSTD